MLKQPASRMKKELAIFLAILFVVSLTAVTSNAKTNGSDKIVDVSIQKFAFSPTSVEISAGDTVRWTNMDPVDHMVAATIFTSGTISKGQSYEFLFTKPGVYNYECSIHPSMKGTITVIAKK
jgi:plastocyanin